MKAFLLLSVILLTQGRMLFKGNWKGFTRTSKPSPLDTMSGVMAGLALTEQNLALSPCLEDLEKMSSELTKIFVSVERPSFTGLFTVLRQIELVLRDLPATISDCMEEIKSKSARVEAGLQVIRNPKSTQYIEGEALLINGVDVYEDVLKIKENLLLSRWFEAGFVIGHVITKLAPSA